MLYQAACKRYCTWRIDNHPTYIVKFVNRLQLRLIYNICLHPNINVFSFLSYRIRELYFIIDKTYSHFSLILYWNIINGYTIILPRSLHNSVFYVSNHGIKYYKTVGFDVNRSRHDVNTITCIIKQRKKTSSWHSTSAQFDELSVWGVYSNY